MTRDAHGVYHLFFPAKDDEGRFRIGHAQAREQLAADARAKDAARK